MSFEYFNACENYNLRWILSCFLQVKLTQYRSRIFCAFNIRCGFYHYPISWFEFSRVNAERCPKVILSDKYDLAVSGFYVPLEGFLKIFLWYFVQLLKFYFAFLNKTLIDLLNQS